MAKSKEQKREEARQRQNAYSWQRVDVPLDMPFLWEDYDHKWESCESIEEQYDFLTEECLLTKPYWA